MVTTQPPPPRKSRRDRFLQVAERRTLRVLQDLRLLARCGNKAAYEYNSDDIRKIFAAITAELERAKAKFSGEPEVNFRLREEDSP